MAVELQLLPDRVSGYISGLPLFPPLEASTHTEIVSLTHVEHCLRMLDACLLGRWQDEEEHDVPGASPLRTEREEALHKSLVALCISAEILSREDEYAGYRIPGTYGILNIALTCNNSSSATKCLESLFRVMINITHDNEDWCRGALDTGMMLHTIVRLITTSQRQRMAATLSMSNDNPEVGGVEDAAAAHLDRLCLALGLFTNLVQVVDEVKELVGDTSK